MSRALHLISLVLYCFLLLSNFGCTNKKVTKQLELTQVEKLYIESFPVVKLVVDSAYPPLNFTDHEGQLVGLNIDLLKLIEERTGIVVELIPMDLNSATQSAMNYEVDGIVNVEILEAWKAKLVFSEQFFSDPMALVCQKSADEIHAFDDLIGKNVAGLINSKHLDVLKLNCPSSNIVEIRNLTEGLELLSNSQVDGVFADLAPLYHLISSDKYSKLMVGFVEESENGSMIGIRSDKHVLLSIINKGINSISYEERMDIQNRWLHFGYASDYRFLKMIIVILIGIVLIISLWIWSLKMMVKSKTQLLKNQLIVHEKTEVELIRAKERAVESDRLKSSFLANISHEVRTPMNGIIGFADILTMEGISEEERRRYLDLILKSSRQLVSIIDDLVVISQIEAGQIKVHSSDISLKELFDELYSIFLLRTNEKSVTLSYSLEGMNDIVFYTDEVKLKQVLSNLLTNATKFTNVGSISFGAEWVGDKSGFVRFYVKDTGIGIHHQNHKNIFSNFWQIKNRTQENGMGLGLAISKANVEMLGGKIWVESIPGEGASFYFTIPDAESKYKGSAVSFKRAMKHIMN